MIAVSLRTLPVSENIFEQLHTTYRNLWYASSPTDVKRFYKFHVILGYFEVK